MKIRYILASLLMLAAPLDAQTPDSVLLDSARAEAVRSRAFIRGAETQLTKFLALIDRMGLDTTSVPIPDPDPDPEPEPGDAVASFASQFTDAVFWGDNGEWMGTQGFNNPSDYQQFDTSLDPDVPGGSGYRIRGSNGNSFWANFAPSPAARPAVPAVGESLTWRWYHKMVQTVDGNYHPWALGGNTVSPPIAALITYIGTGNYTFMFHFRGMPGDAYQAPNNLMRAGEWYRYELVLTRLTATTWKFEPRVFNEAGAQIAGPEDFVENWRTGSSTLATDTWTLADASLVTQFTWGSNGLSNVSGTVEQDRWAAVAAFPGAHIGLPFPQTGER